MATECSIGCPELVDTACAHPSHTPTGESILVTIRMMLIMTDHGSPDSQDTYILVTTRLLHMQSFEEAAIFILMDAVCKSARRQLSSRAVNGKDAQLADWMWRRTIRACNHTSCATYGIVTYL